MKNNRIYFIISAAVIAFSFNAQARENVGSGGISTHNNPDDGTRSTLVSLCAPAHDQANLDINNIRTTILGGGDMWWNLIRGCYFVPKPAIGSVGPSSLFAGALWVGGFDAGGQLKVAAMTYRQTGNDYWPGPLTSSATTDAATCLAWDKHYIINRQDVENYVNWFNNTPTLPNPVSASAMGVINSWPAYGPEGQPIAPYHDANANGIYDPEGGDYPDFDLAGTRTNCDIGLFGDQSMFWVFNDKGNIHSETGGLQIGLEVQAQAFAFATNDEVNNMTFYRYKVINKSSFQLDSTFFGVWVDCDLGSASDDYVGCDVDLGLGFGYNGDAVDDNPLSGELTYGANPPAIGCDFFEGPFADPNGLDGDPKTVPHSYKGYGDGVVDNERLGMCKFVYYDNVNSVPTGNPAGAQKYYDYLAGDWLDGVPFTYGANARGGTTKCSYMFPGTSDPNGFGVGGNEYSPIGEPEWSEATAGNTPGDRRFMQSAGPFKLQPGAVNIVTFGLVWARATQGGNLASVALMKGADAKAQKLFDNCFKTLDGPTSPNLTIQELNKQLILYWSNPKGSNNYNELYTEDPNLSSGVDSLYRFQGYQIYQLKDATVSTTDLYNIDKARLVFQCDKTDGIKQIVNYEPDINLSALVPQEMVNGADAGIAHSVSINTDQFATGDNTLINHKTYYFAIVAYGYSPSPNTSPFNASIQVEYAPYIAGRKFSDGPSSFVHSAIPHIPSPEAGGTVQSSGYGSGPKLKRVEGHGNGGNILDFTGETVSRILSASSGRVTDPVYDNAHGPVNIKVVDPLNVPDGDFRLFIYDTTSLVNVTTKARWKLIDLSTNDTVYSDQSIAVPNEQIINNQPIGTGASRLIPKWGMSVEAVFAYDPGSTSTLAVNNGFLDATMEFADPSKQWLTAIADQDGATDFNWIRSGTATFPAPDNVYNDYAAIDNTKAYQKVLGGTWAPYRLCANSGTATPLVCQGGPAWGTLMTLNQLKNTASVDVIITNDRSKWTRCPVIELEEQSTLAIGGVAKMSMRASPSVDKNGTANYPSTDNNDYATGMGWFPGYAINLETGERLNMAFGEDSWLTTENGADMKWNPTANTQSAIFDPSSGSFDPIFGGKHYIYVFGHNGDGRYLSTDPLLPNGLKDVPAYDMGKVEHDLLAAAASVTGSASDGYKREVYADAMWVNIPMLIPGHSVLETDVKVRLRVSKSYQRGYTYQVPTVAGQPVDTSMAPINRNFPVYEFNTSDIKTTTNSLAAAKDALDIINIVPNPYYAYSNYEKTTLDNIVKITNLPDQCTVSIYSLDGTLVRKLKKDDSTTSLDWDLKNQARISIASGMYIIYVDVPGVGQKTLKWFGVTRALDLDQY